MSLIYQALKQSEQQTTALSQSRVARKASAAPMAGKKPGHKVLGPLGLGVVIAGAGVLVGYFLTQGFAAPGSAQALQPTAPHSAQVAGLYDPPERPDPDTGTMGLLPRADLPLPTTAPRLRLALTLAPEGKKTPVQGRTEEGAAPATAKAYKPVESPQPATKVLANHSPVVLHTPKVEIPAVQPSTEDVRTLFEGLNQALENHDKALAQVKLQGIQSKLPESSVARLRAESWFAHQTGDLDTASRIYRRLLEKMPGDELTSINLASIEKKRQRPDSAKDVLANALRQNPSSSMLRSAIEQLAQGEIKP